MEPTEVDASNAELISQLVLDQSFWAQQKLDGVRLLSVFTEEGISFVGRKRQPMKSTMVTQYLPELRERLEKLRDAGHSGSFALDGEMMLDGTYCLFDMVPDEESRDMPYAERWRWLSRFVRIINEPTVRRVSTAFAAGEKAELFVKMRDLGYEGVVFRDKMQTYTQARTTSVLKAKFTKTADVVVLDYTRGRNEEGREVGSATFGVVADKDHYKVLGSCSLIGKPEVKIGDVIEVRYLYWSGSSLVQPRMMRVRDDKRSADCTLDQFTTYKREVF